MTEEEDLRIIKKYPNRRLYDTAISSYITLEDVRKCVLDEIHFKVIDAKTSEDITISTLLQIINEQEDENEPIFTVSVLKNIVKFQGHPLKYILRRYLHQSMLFFLAHQSTLEEDVQLIMEHKPNVVIHEIAERNLAVWLDLQRQGLEKAAELEVETHEDAGEAEV